MINDKNGNYDVYKIDIKPKYKKGQLKKHILIILGIIIIIVILLIIAKNTVNSIELHKETQEYQAQIEQLQKEEEAKQAEILKQKEEERQAKIPKITDTR